MADSINGWVVVELNKIYPLAVNTKLNVVELGNFVKKLRVHTKEAGKKLIAEYSGKLHDLYRSLMQDGLKVA